MTVRYIFGSNFTDLNLFQVSLLTILILRRYKSLSPELSGWLDRLRFRLPVYRPSNFLKGVSQHHRVCA